MKDYKNMEAIKNDDNDLCKLQNFAINNLYHLLTYANILNVKYDVSIEVKK